MKVQEQDYTATNNYQKNMPILIAAVSLIGAIGMLVGRLCSEAL
jgi:hypothetical protein